MLKTDKFGYTKKGRKTHLGIAKIKFLPLLGNNIIYLLTNVNMN